jgi:hypothetical protein
MFNDSEYAVRDAGRSTVGVVAMDASSSDREVFSSFNGSRPRSVPCSGNWWQACVGAPG